MYRLKPTKQRPFKKKTIGFDIETYHSDGVGREVFMHKGDHKRHLERFSYRDGTLYTGRVQNRFLMASMFADDWERFFYSAREVIDYIQQNPHLFEDTFIVATNLSFDFFGTFFNEKEILQFNTLFRGSSLITAETFLHDNKFVRLLDKDIKRRKKVCFIDTLNYAMIGVEKAGKIIGFPKMETPECLGIKPQSPLEWERMRIYNMRDSEVSKKFIDFLFNAFQRLGASPKKTIASTAMSLFKNIYLSKEFFVHPKEILRDIFQGYYGGRTEAFSRGIIRSAVLNDKMQWRPLEKRWDYYDLNSLYPTVMQKEVPHPNYINKNEYNTLDYINQYEGMSNVSIHCPYMKYPYLPYRTASKLLFPVGNWTAWYTHFELREAIRLGYTITKVHKTYWYNKTLPVFKEYAQELYQTRLKYKGDGNPMEYVVKILLNCFSSDTDILTEKGHKNIKDIKTGEKVYSINPDTLETEMKEVTRTYKYKYDGKMVRFDNKKVDLLVTPNHRMFMSKTWKNDYGFTLAEDVYDHKFHNPRRIKGELFKEFNLKRYIYDDEQIIERDGIKLWKPNNSYSKIDGVPFKFESKDFMKLCGWYVSEGNPVQYGIKLTKKKIDEKKEIEELCYRLGLHFYSNKEGVFIYHRLIMQFMIDNFGQYCSKKYIHDDIFKLDYSLLQCLWDKMMKGDGSLLEYSSGGFCQSFKYTTKSKRLANGFQRLCIHLGKRTKIRFEVGKGTAGSVYRIFIYRQGTCQIRKNREQIREEKNIDGFVYCIEAKDNHTVYAGRNGTLISVGQSLYGKTGEKFDNKDNWLPALTLEEIEKYDVVERINEFFRVKIIDGKPAVHCFPIWATHITAFARHELYKAISTVNPIYVDTDSVITQKELPTGKNLGEWKLEMSILEGIIVKPKFYALVPSDIFDNSDAKETVKIKGLGARLSYLEFEGLLTSKTIGYSKFVKFKEAVRREFQPNEIMGITKAFSLEDEKRKWIGKFDRDTLQDSEPLNVIDGVSELELGHGTGLVEMGYENGMKVFSDVEKR